VNVDVAPCPKCRRLDRLVCEIDEKKGTDRIRCTTCRVLGPIAPWSTHATDPPGSLPAWNKKYGDRVSSLFE
jgi:hypothetical protein